MSFGKRQQGNITYFRVAGGKLVRPAKADTPGAVAVQTPQGEVVHQLHDDFVEGSIAGFEDKTSEFNGKTTRSLVVIMQDGDEVYRIEVSRGKQYWSDFLMRLPNLDFDKRVAISPYDITDKDTGRRQQGMSMKQDGRKIARAFSKENPGKLPQPTQVKVNDALVYDWGARNAFLEDVVLVEAKQRLTAKIQEAPPLGECVEAAPPQPAPVELSDDDLPF